MTIQEELRNYWKINNLPLDGGLKDKFNEIKLGKLLIKYPNLDGKALLLHDINHLITGYQTTWQGECEVSAWELASGGRVGHPISLIYPLLLFVIGIFIFPQKTIKAYKLGKGKKNSFVIASSTNIMKLSKHEVIIKAHI